MARDAKAEAALALHRFGFGPRAVSIAAIASDPRGALLAELDRKGVGLTTAPGLMSSAQASRAIADFNAERQAQDRMDRRKREAEQARMQAASSTQVARAPKAAAPPPPPAQPASAPKPAPAAAPAPPPVPQRISL